MLLLTWSTCRFQANANPTGGTVTQGRATFSTSGSQFNINQTSANAFINWQGFNVGPNEVVNFNQPTAQSVTFNQINQGSASQIMGNINANGYIVLENANGFSIGGQAAITTHGLVMTTATTPNLNFSDGGPWSFNTPPPGATIQNYGKINITGGGTAFLIAADIVNNGTITAPNGRIGLYDGETVLVSSTPNGLGLNAVVTLPLGSVDNEGNLTANGGTVVAQAQFVNQNGIIQANRAQNINGTIELLGDNSVTLGASSAISAAGDSTAAGPSAGGSVQIQAGTSFSDVSGSAINVSGAAQGGNAGQISISAPQMSALNSTLNGQAAAGYLNGKLSINTADIALNVGGVPVANALALDVNALSSGFSQINLLASDIIALNTPWTLAVNGGIPSSVFLSAGNAINLDSGSKIEADGGNITLKAPTVNLTGILQANSVGSANGVVEVDASQNLNLQTGSAISATGTGNTTSPGGFVILNAGNIYSDSSSAASPFSIYVSGAAGGRGGIVEIFNPQAAPTATAPATVSGAFAYLLNPYDVTFSSAGTGTSPSGNNLDANFNLSNLGAYSRIDLHALDNIEISASWTLNQSTLPAVLRLTAGNNIIVDDGKSLSAKQGWSLNLAAGTGFVPTAAQPAPASGSDGLYLDGAASILSQNGDVNLWAANEVQVGWTGTASAAGVANSGVGFINTTAGGNINVTTMYGDVNTGSGIAGFTYLNAAPYFKASSGLGGISTANGGNININAGGNAISYTPSSSDPSAIDNDPGTGAFGTAPGNVTVTAGDSIYGHYVLANGTGTITAKNGDVGTSGDGDQFALSLINGTWFVNAPKGNIFLTEVRNPTGDYNNALPTLTHKGNSWVNLFTYGADAAVDLTAGVGVYLTDTALARDGKTSDSSVSVIYPPILDITAGAGGVTLEGDVILFPSLDQNLNIITTDGGNLISAAPGGAIPELLMSDSSQTRWLTTLGVGGNITSFSVEDQGSVLPIEYQPVIINISGDIGGPDANLGYHNLTGLGLNIITTKESDITVGHDLINSGFSGLNLSANDVTTINVAGQIYNDSTFSFAYDVAIPSIPIGDAPFIVGNSWDDIFYLAVNPANLSPGLVNPAETPLANLQQILIRASWFGVTVDPNGRLSVNPSDEGFNFNPATGRLSFNGLMPLSLYQLLTPASGTFDVLHLVNGRPVLDENQNDKDANAKPGRTYGEIEYDTVSWAPASAINTLYAESQHAASFELPGYFIGGPGEFDITAGSISLGNSYGIISYGVYNDAEANFGGSPALTSLDPSGASINVTVTGPDANNVSSLTMLQSAIAALGGGDVTVINEQGSMDLGLQDLPNSGSSQQSGIGIFTSGGGNANVIARGDVNIDGSRIATYNGGDIFVESLTGDVNVGSGSSTENEVSVSYVNPVGGTASYYHETPFGSGIIANTLVPELPGGTFWPPNPANAPGNITVETPEGSIKTTSAGIVQVALNGNNAPGPTVTLTAGTFPSAGSPGYVGNIDLGKSGVIGGTVNLSANGNITGQIISRQNSSVNAAQSFSGTLLAGGSADVSGGGTISGTIIGVGGASVSGQNITASVLGQNVSVNGGASQDTLGSSANATSATQSATQTASSQSQQQVAADTAEKDDRKGLKTQIRKVGHVTVILASAR
jgi:filamentous hemagglutinin family protein